MANMYLSVYVRVSLAETSLEQAIFSFLAQISKVFSLLSLSTLPVSSQMELKILRPSVVYLKDTS